MAPIPFTGTAEQAIDGLKAALAALPRLRVVAEEGLYLRAEATSRVFRFVDDVEFLVDAADKVIRFRSASRLGYFDFGVNRARMRRLGKVFAAGVRRALGPGVPRDRPRP